MNNRPDKVILHCSDTKDSKKSIISLDDIDRWHKEKGWKKIGYHFYITRDGEVHKGRNINEIGAHCLKQNNNSIGICYEGRYFPSIIQIDALCNLYRTIKHTYGVTDWYGHREFADKECPGFDIEDLKLIFKKLA